MAGTFEAITSQLGMSLWILVVILIWDGIWKLISMWKAAQNKSLVWFIILALVNSVGILPILYIYVFSKFSNKPKQNRIKKVRSNIIKLKKK